MAENTELNQNKELELPVQDGQPSVPVPETEKERLDFFNFLLKLLEKIKEIAGTKAAYTQKDIREIKKATKQIQNALESGSYSNTEMAELGACLCGVKNAMELDKPFEAKECLSMAESLVIDKQVGRMLDKNNDLKLVKNDLGVDLVFCPAAGKDEMGLLAIKDGKIQGWYKDIEQLQQDFGDQNIVLSADNFLDVNANDIRELAVNAWTEKREELHQVCEERLFQTELNSKVSGEYIQSVVEMIQTSEAFDKDNMDIIVNEENGTILVQDKYKEVDAEKLVFVLANDNDHEFISSIRMANDSFDNKDFDKEEMLRSSSALIYVGKQSVLDHSKGFYTTQDAFVANSSLDGVAMEISQELAKNMDMELVDAAKEKIEEIKESITEARQEVAEKEQEDLTKF